MATIGTQSLSQLVKVSDTVSGMPGLRKSFFDPKLSQVFMAKFHPLAAQSDVLRQVAEASMSGGACALSGVAGTGKSCLMMMLGKLLSLPFPSAEFSGLCANLNSLSCVKAITSLRTEGRSWLIVVPEFTKNEDFDAGMIRSLNGALFQQGCEEFVPSGSDAVSVFKETSDFLRESGRFDGILILCARFDTYFDKIVKSPEGKEAKQTEALVQFCTQSRFPSMMVVSLDCDPSNMTMEVENRALDVFTNIFSVSLLGKAGEWEELVGKVVLEHPKDDNWEAVTSYKDFRVIVETLSRMGLYQGFSDRWIQETVMQGAYPFHPAALFVLPRVAQCVGAKGKTAFTFFADTTSGSLQFFLNNFAVVQPNGRLHLYTADMLFSYFEKVLEKDPVNHDYLEALQKSVMLAGDIPQTRRILRIILILQLVGHERLRTTADTLFWALHLGERETRVIRHSLDLLVQKKALQFNESTGEYMLPITRRKIGVDEAFKRISNRMRSQLDVRAELKAALPCRNFVLSEYNEMFGTDRSAFAEVFTVNDLRDSTHFAEQVETTMAQIRPYRGDLMVAYVIPEEVSDLERLQSEALDGRYNHPRLVLALPKKVSSFSKDMVDARAWQRLSQNEPPFNDPNSSDYKQVAERARIAKKKVEDELGGLFDPKGLEFYYCGDCENSLDEEGLIAWLTKLVRDIVGAPPLTEEPVLSRLRDHGHSRRKRQQAVDYLINSRGDLALRSDAGKIGEILRYGLVDSGLMVETAEKVNWKHYALSAVAKGGGSASGMPGAFAFLRSKVVAQAGESCRVPAADVVCELLRAPYGLTPALVELTMALLIATWKDNISIKKGWARAQAEDQNELLEDVPVSSASLFSLVSNPKDWLICFQDVTPAQKTFLQGLTECCGGSLEGFDSMWQAASSAVLNWFDALPSAARQKGATGDAHSEGLVILLSNSKKRTNLRRLSEVLLPRALGALPNFVWENEGDALLERFRGVYGRLNSVVSQRLSFLEDGLTKIYASYDGSDSGKSWPERVNAWLEGMGEFINKENWSEEYAALVAAAQEDSSEALTVLLHGLSYPELEDWKHDLGPEILERLSTMRQDGEWSSYRQGYSLLDTDRVALAQINCVLDNSGLDKSSIEAMLVEEVENLACADLVDEPEPEVDEPEPEVDEPEPEVVEPEPEAVEPEPEAVEPEPEAVEPEPEVVEPEPEVVEPEPEVVEPEPEAVEPEPEAVEPEPEVVEPEPEVVEPEPEVVEPEPEVVEPEPEVVEPAEGDQYDDAIMNWL